MNMTYDPRNWYWLSDDGRLYSSRSREIIQSNDPELAEWKAAGGVPTRWPCDEAGVQSQLTLENLLARRGGVSGSVPVTTSKADLYRRATDEEAEKIEQALMTAPVRQRRLFESALYLDHADAEFAAMHAALVDLFGEDRADALLAPS